MKEREGEMKEGRNRKTWIRREEGERRRRGGNDEARRRELRKNK